MAQSRAYKMVFDKIESRDYDKDDLLNKMDVFLMCNRITGEQYKELKGKMEADEEVTAE